MKIIKLFPITKGRQFHIPITKQAPQKHLVEDEGYHHEYWQVPSGVRQEEDDLQPGLQEFSWRGAEETKVAQWWGRQRRATSSYTHHTVVWRAG